MSRQGMQKTKITGDDNDIGTGGNHGESDIIILVMGPTGVGKSTFINTAAGKTVAEVEHGLNSCATAIRPFLVHHPHQSACRIVFVDTPGLDDTYIEYPTILRSTSAWLARSCGEGSTFAGVIYLHDITQARSAGSEKTHTVVRKLCGDDAVKNVILATTKWDDVIDEVGEQHEQELSKIWKEMLNQGSKMAQFRLTHESAWAIVDLIVNRSDYPHFPLPITMPSPKRTKNLFLKMKAGDNDTIITLPDPRESDIIIPIMGPSGVGKSAFINTATKTNSTTVGHDLKSCTAKIQPVIFPYPNDPTRRIVFVDTPGFDATFTEDSEILRRVAVWLARSYNDGMKLAGIIYLHDITLGRMLGTTRRNLDVFNKLCGDEAFKNVVLVTMKWGDMASGCEMERELELAGEHWKNMLDKGATMARYMGTHDSAWDIIDLVLQQDQVEVLLIQQELVDLQKILPETEAGLALRYTLQELLKAQKEMAKQLRTLAQESAEIQRRYEENQKQLRSTLKQIRDLKIPVSRRILKFFFPR